MKNRSNEQDHYNVSKQMINEMKKGKNVEKGK